MASLVMTPNAKQILMPWREKESRRASLFRGRRVLGDGLGTLRNSVLRELTGQDKTDTRDASVEARESRANQATYEVWISRDEMVDFLL